MKYILPALVGILNFGISSYLVNNDECILNIGIAFGIRISYEVVIISLLLISLIYLSSKVSSNLRVYIFSIVILGASNLVVRLIYGYICDYISLFNISFNIVDVGIVLYTGISVLEIFKEKEKI